MRALSGRRSRTALSLLVVTGAFIAPMVAGAPPAGAAAEAPRAATAAAQTAAAGPLSVTQASARARATDAPVVVGSLTTATSQTTALPDGQLRVTESLEPVRTMRAGTWVTLDPRLQKVAGGRIAPAVTTRPLSLSDGGAGPLAVLDNYGRTLTLTWPGGNLPAPVVTGATATYPNIEPGIDLAVTATSQGDISELAVIHDAAAATGSGLAAALQVHASGPGLTVTTGKNGGLEATTGPGADPAFTSAAPQVWDSAAPPAGTRTATVNGATVVAPSGMPAESSAAGPGAYAHVSTATQSASGGTITVAPPTASLRGSGVIYPVYVDPAWAGVPVSTKAAAWTMIESGYPTETGWDQSGAPYLEVGYCDPNNLSGCNGIGVTRSMFRFNLPGEPSGSTVTSADVYVDDLWSSADCAKEPLELYWTGSISSGTDWSNGSSSWGNEMEEEDIAGYGSSSSCPSSANDITFGSGTTATGSTSAGTLASTLTTGLDKDWANITLGLKAADESTTDGTAWLQWRYFQDTAADITMSYTYHYPPAAPKLTIEPAGDCQTSAAAADANPVGDDDITIDGTISDGDGDTGLTTKTTVYNSSNTSVEGAWTYGPGAGVTGQSLGTIQRGALTTGTYHVTAVTTDSFSETASSTCYIYVDLTAPERPVVTGLPATTTLGGQLTGLTFSPAAGDSCTATPDPCPTTYTYQIGDRSPVTVKVTNTTTDVYVQPSSSPITVPIVGPFDFSVSGTDAAGNASPAAVTVVTSDAPTSPVADGYFTNGSYPDLLTTDTAATDASLWLSPGTGNGAVGPATDIGGLGTGQNPGSDGPADWNHTQVIQGDLTGNNVQDILAYYTTASTTVTPGTGVIIGGTGSAVPPNPNSGSNYINPASGNAWEIAEDDQDFCDSSWAISCPPLADVAYAGNASLEGSDTNDGINSATNNSDLIGIFGPNSSGDYELDLFTALDTSVYGLDGVHGVLSTTSPDGTDDWQDYTLATVELPDTANPHGDPSDIALFALNDTVGSADAGKLYVSTGSGCTSATFTTSSCLLPGMAGTWSAAVAGTPSSWATTPPKLDSADVTSGSSGAGSGTPEIWTVSGSTATAYAISGVGGTPSAAAEGSGSSLTYPNDSWALNDGAANAGDNPAAVTDSVTGVTDSITGTGYSWAEDNNFGEVLDTTSAYYYPATNPIPNDGTAATVSLWFKTTGTNEVLVSRQGQVIPAGTATGAPASGAYNPVLYVGNDGKLCFQWWVNDISSTQCNTTVDNGLWHHATLAANGDSQTLTLDGATQTITGEVSLSSTYLDIGAGSLGGAWPDEIYENKDGSQGYWTYFNGEIADVTVTK